MSKNLILLTNFIPPYRLPLYKAMRDRVNELRVLISTPIEPNRSWSPTWEGLRVTVQKTLTFTHKTKHPHGFSEELFVHIPYDTLCLLRRYRPDIIISGEMGLRSILALIYRTFHPKSRLILWATVSEYSEKGRGRIREWLRRILVPRADAVLVNGQSGARYVRQFGVPDEAIFFAPYATDIAPFLAYPLSRDNCTAYRLLYVGQLVERKGLIPFLRTLACWAEDHPQHQIELWAAGDGPMRPVLEKIGLPINLVLRIIGNVDYAKIQDIYRQAGILVFPTLADEWGLVVNEAMAAGLPVLGSRYSQAVEELVEDGKTGWIFRPDCEREMYKALDRVLTTPRDVIEKMRGSARDRVKQLTPEFVADRFLKAIEYLYSKNSPFHKRVLIVQRRMTDYRVPLFDQMRDRLAQAGVELNVVYGTPMRSEVLRGDQGILPWGIRTPCRYLSIGPHSLVYQPITGELLQQQDLIIIPHENRLLLSYMQVHLHRSPQTHIAFFGHGANFQSRQKNGYGERFKTWTTRQADWYFAYTALSRNHVANGGFPEDRITCINNAVDVNAMIAWQKSITPDEIYALRKALGLKGDHTGIFIGSLYKDKNLPFLFRAADALRRRLPDFELVLIGDGPHRRLMASLVQERPWAVWVGAKHGREKVLHLSLGKVMLNPGLVGLSILDSFALGIPMVTTDCGFHSPEIAYLELGRNGLMVPMDVDAYVNAVKHLLEDDDARHAMIAACREDAGRYSLDAMAENFCRGIALALESPKKTRG